MNSIADHQTKTGYKETKIGRIPEDWDISSLKECSKITMGQSPSSSYYNFDGIGLPLIQGNADIKNGESSPRCWTSQITKECNVGDILLSVRAPVGEVSISTHHACIGRGICSIKFKNRNLFLFHYLVFFKSKWIKYSQGSTFDAVTTNELYKLIIPIPSNYEQQKISEILSTWDRAIECLDKLIKAKQRMKKGLMQQLLTGKKRFPEFGEAVEKSSEIPNGWSYVKFHEIFKLIKRKNSNGLTRVLTISGEYGLIKQTDFFKKSVAGKELREYYLVKRGEFAYNRSSMIGYPFGAIKRLDEYENGVLSTLYICFALREQQKSNSDYFRYYFDSSMLNNQLRKITQVGGRAHGLLNITNKDFLNIDLLSFSEEEQHQITNTLSLNNEEIKKLKFYKMKIETQKRGFMQKLLTGEIRVLKGDTV